MKIKRKALIIVGVLVAFIGLVFINRLYILQYSLGWYTDWANPRSAPQDISWANGPATESTPATQRAPNIIVILVDDLGINDVTMHGGGRGAEGVPTPNIDAIAKAGVRFDQAYAGSAVCTVSRAALLTGRYPWRFGVEFTPTPGAMARVAGSLYADPTKPHPISVDHAKAKATPSFDKLGMPPSELTAAEILKERGYHNIHIGKWHLGATGPSSAMWRSISRMRPSRLRAPLRPRSSARSTPRRPPSSVWWRTSTTIWGASCSTSRTAVWRRTKSSSG